MFKFSDQEIINQAKQAIKTEGQAVLKLQDFIDEKFVSAIKLLAQTKGRIVISGIGKSAIVAQKIVATLNSTGTPSIFMHAADAIHGDLGIVQSDDLVIVVSKSGDSPEIKVLIPLVKNLGSHLLGITANAQSFLAINSDIFLLAAAEEEACPNNLAPTTSTTTQMVLGDAIAVCLMNLKGFGVGDFAKYHPGGTLGKKLYTTVADLVGEGNNPRVYLDASLKEVILEMTSKRLGATVVTNSEQIIEGIITDGDLRRMLDREGLKLNEIIAKDIMTQNPKKINADALAIDAWQTMQINNINQLVVTKNNGDYLGLLHIQQLIKEGIIL